MTGVISKLKQFFWPEDNAPARPIPQPIPAAAPAFEGVIVPNTNPLYNGTPIPSYPDKGIATPAATPEMLYESQIELINRLQQSSSFSHDDFTNLVRPAILNYAAYVHLLPASETNHHCGQGGLFRHGLEVALNASNACIGKVFAWDAWASEREKLIPRWRMCAMLGGMLHDMGKPIVDVGAIDESGTLTWNPHTGSLYDWLAENKLTHYYIQWRPGARHKRHEAFNPITIYRIIPDATMRWLGEVGGQEPLDYMVMSLNGSTDPRNPISAIIKKADSDSVDRDIRDSRHRLSASGQGGARNLAARIIRVMYDQIEGGQWHINKPSSPIYVTDQGIFGMYPAVISEAIDILRGQGEMSLPKDSAAVLELLADWRFIEPNRILNGPVTNTWNVRMHLQNNGREVQTAMHLICFAREEIIPTSILPQTKIRADILGHDGKPIEQGTVSPPPNTNPKQPAKPASKAPAKPTAETPQRAESPTLYQPPIQVDDEHDVPEDLSIFNEDTSSHPLPAEPEDPEIRDRANEEDLREIAIQEAHEHVNRTFPPTNAKDAADWLSESKQSPQGAFLLQIIKRLNDGALTEGKHVFERDGRIYLASPKAFDQLGMDPNDVREMFEEKGWHEMDAISNSRTTVPLEVGSKKIYCTQLNADLSAIFSLLKAKPAQATEAIEKKPATTLPMGPNISKSQAAMFSSFTKFIEFDSYLIRPIVHDYLVEACRVDGITLETLTPEQTTELIQTFVKTHSLKKVWLKNHLYAVPNQLCINAKQLASDFNTDIQLNLEYNPLSDSRLSGIDILNA